MRVNLNEIVGFEQHITAMLRERIQARLITEFDKWVTNELKPPMLSQIVYGLEDIKLRRSTNADAVFEIVFPNIKVEDKND